MIFDSTSSSLLSDLMRKHGDSVDFLEIRFEKVDRDFLHFDENGVRNVGSNSRIGGCVRSCYKGGWGFAAFSDLFSVEDMIQQAIGISKLIGCGKTRLAEVTPVVDQVDINPVIDPREIPIETKIALFNSYLDVFRSFPSDRIKAFGVNYSEQFHRKHYINSEGTNIKQEFLSMDVMLRTTAFYNGVQTLMYEMLNSTKNFDIFYNCESILHELCRNAVLFSDAPDMKGGRYPVILDPRLAATFAHESFGHTSEADLFANTPGGRETLQIGRRFGPEILNIYDTGLMDDYAGSMKYDDEGVPTEKTDLIKEGVLVGRLHSRETAADFDEKPTGNARAVDYRYAPIVRMRNTCIAPGKDSFEDLLSGIKEGVLAISLYGGHGGENFSFTPNRGFMIRNGKVAEPVKNFTIMGNLFETLHKIDGVGGADSFSTTAASSESGGCGKFEQFPLPVGMSAPYLRFSEITVSGS
jgi:TldD protein